MLLPSSFPTQEKTNKATKVQGTIHENHQKDAHVLNIKLEDGSEVGGSGAQFSQCPAGTPS